MATDDTWHSPIRRYLADPNLAIINDPRHGNRPRWFLYCTQDGAANWGATDFHVYTSDDLVAWTDEGRILGLSDVSWAKGPGNGGGGAWAPTVLRADGRYYFYFVADSQVGVAVADSPYGPFIPAVEPLVSVESGWPGHPIDPSILRLADGQENSLNPGTPADDGTAGAVTDYLVWGNTVASVCRLSDDRLHLVTDPARKVRGWTPDSFREAMWIIKRKGVYYASWSVDDTRSPDYHLEYATAPSLDGPWTEHGTLLRGDAATGMVGTGHHSITRIPGTDTWIIAYHCFDAATGDGVHRQVRFDRLRFREDGTLEPLTVRSAGEDGAFFSQRI